LTLLLLLLQLLQLRLLLQGILQCSQSVNPKVRNKLAALHNLKICLEPCDAKVKIVN